MPKRSRRLASGRRRDVVAATMPTWAQVKQAAVAEPFIITHRGAGENLAIDGALSSLDFAMAQGMDHKMVFDGGDNRLNGSGTLVVSHDANTGIYMNQDVVVANTIDTTWKGTLRMQDFPLYRGTSSNEPPPYTREWLQKCLDYKRFVVPETKIGGAGATALANLIVELGMTQNVQMQAFDASWLAAADSAGISTGLLQNAGANIGFPAILTAVNGHAPDLVLYDPAADPGDAYLQQAINAGIALQCGTVNRRFTMDAQRNRIAALGGNITFIVSNDPFYIGRKTTPLTADRFDTQQWEHGIIKSDNASGPQISGGKLRFNNGAVSQNALLGCFSGGAPFKTMEFDMTFETLDVTTARFGSIYFGIADDRNMHDGIANSPGAVNCLLRQTGEMRIFNRTNTTTSTGVAGLGAADPGTRSVSTTPSAITVPGTTVRLRIENLTDETGAFIGQTKFTRLDIDQWIMTAVGGAPIRGSYVHAGKNSTAGGTVSFSKFVVTY